MFYVRTFLCVRIHTGVGHTDESAQHFDSEKLSKFCLVLRTGFEPSTFGSESDTLLIEPPHHPSANIVITPMVIFFSLSLRNADPQ